MKASKKICYIDLDGIFTSYPKCWLEYIKIKTGKTFDSLEIARKKIAQDEYKNLKRDYRSSDFKYNLKPTEGSSEFSRFLQKKKFFTVIATQRPQEHPKLEERTVEWLQKNKIFYNELAFVKNKLNILSKYPSLAFGVDDEIEICRELAARGYKMFLMCRQPENQKFRNKLYENIYLVNTFQDILKSVPETIIDALNPWFYRLKIGNQYTKPGIGTKFDEEFLLNRQKNRKKMLIDSWATKNDVKGSSVLDVGCNAGYWSYCLQKLGASKILGIEGRALFIRQAELFYRADKVRCDYRFIQGNAADLKTYSSIEPHDIVICTGLLYHIPNWEEVLYALSKLTKKLLIVDTRISSEDVYIKETPNYFNAIQESFNKRVPTSEKLLGILSKNFVEVNTVKPFFEDMKGLSGVDSYNLGNRLCIIARKKARKNKR